MAVSDPSNSIGLTDTQLRATSLPVSISQTALTANSATNVTVTTATTVILAANASRKGLILVNTGNRSVFIGIGVAAVDLKGIYLSANGGSWSMDAYSLTTQAINGIAITASSNVAIQEFQ